MADTESDTLIIKHLPQDLTDNDKEELLRHVGATCVRCMSNKGHLKHTAFATFPNHAAAKKAMTRLHQLEILGHRLVAALSNKQYSQHHPAVTDSKPLSGQLDSEKECSAKVPKLAPDRHKIADKINSQAPKWGLDYPLDPRLEYVYPTPSVSTLTNIANALASVPRFYVQVLHLMNKMNLPAPFGAMTPTPPLPENVVEEAVAPPLPPTEPPLPPEPEEPSSSSEESELESEGEGEGEGKAKAQLPVKRLAKESSQPRKRHKLQKVVVAAPKVATAQLLKTDEVFEQPESSAAKKRGFTVNLSSVIAGCMQQHQENTAGLVPSGELQSNQTPTTLSTPDQHMPVALPAEHLAQQLQQHQPLPPPPPLDLLSMVESQPVVEAGGFGKLEPVSKAGEGEEEEDMEEEEEWGAGEFISSRRLRRGRISSSQMRDFSVFRSYQAGEATSRLYIKNLSRQVSQKDLHYIYGRYVDWDSEQEKIMFDIRLMKEGRMKGQAFVTLPGEKVAKEAVHDTNGFLLEGKPMVVQFARSAKPKEKDADKGGGKKKPQS